MAIRRIGVIMHGVTGRMGTNQHLVRSILAIRRDGGVLLESGDRAMPDPILVGRSAEKTEALARAHGVERWTTDLAAALANQDDEVFFDAATTQMRPAVVEQAIEAGKHIYCEKPTATTLAEALAIARLAEERGIKNGAVQDKLFLPGLLKLKMLRDSGFFGRMLAVRGEFGYWVFEGDLQPTQRPSWNYRAEDGGGIILDMLCHWRYVLDGVFGEVESLSCLGATHIPRRWDEVGKPYDATADDAAYATLLLEGGVVAQINSSWATRVYRDDLAIFQVDGTHGSAIAGLQSCKMQHRMATPRPVWNPDEKRAEDFRADWQEVPDTRPYPNGFRAQWEMFLRHVAEDAPWRHSLLEGAKGVQLAELSLQSWKERRWVDVPALSTAVGVSRARRVARAG
jgi:predicted dehydrogenase